MTAEDPCPYPSYEGTTDSEMPVPARGETATGIERRVFEALETVEDPEMPISIVDLGLIYGVSVTDGVATVELTLTYSGCPARDLLCETIEARVEQLDPIETCSIELVWNPPWSIEMVSANGKAALESFGVSVQ
ncbi:metal-sulfur cluster assembly factor [Halocatena halophila]|uniref:metal-sulfur cluster assembly factor n=1 Tax=Halocatena halophila TaxID=2814576 RepID=UPI002ED2A050